MGMSDPDSVLLLEIINKPDFKVIILPRQPTIEVNFQPTIRYFHSVNVPVMDGCSKLKNSFFKKKQETTETLLFSFFFFYLSI